MELEEFEVTAQALTASFSAKFGPLTVLYRPSRKEGLGQVMEATRARPGLDTAPTTLAGVRQMIKALRAGRAVGLLPDQVPPEGMGQWTPFFGKPAYTMTLAARLALQTGAQTASGIATGGASSLANLGNQQRGIDQQGLDATYQGLQRYASTIYGNPARQQATGGK